MILRLLFLTYILYVSPALCRMSAQEFENTIDTICFKNKESLINGQENPLPNTLENFISLAEKFEIANPSLDFKEEVYYFLRHYVYENIVFSSSGISQWKPNSGDLYDVEMMWETDTSHMDRFSFEDPFTEAEKCSLYFMISHSIVDKAVELPELRSYGNIRLGKLLLPDSIDSQVSSLGDPKIGILKSPSSNGNTRNLNFDDVYPQEIGVVAIRGTDMAVSLSRVLYGMYVGLKQDREVEILSYQKVSSKFSNVIQQGTKVDKLYTLTLAEVLALSTWSLESRKGFAPNGEWKSISLDGYSDIRDFCPLVYTQQSAQNVFSYSSVRGAADGLILGSIVSEIIAKKPKTRLTQLLRMYYSRDGVPVEQGMIETSPVQRVSFCKRTDVVDPLEKTLLQQTELYYYLVADRLGVKNDSFDNAVKMYAKYKRDIYETSDTELSKYCAEVPSLEQPENLPRENFLDVIVVMDTSNSEDAFRKQKKITGLLAKQLDLRYTGSRMTILLDKRINTGTSTSVRIELQPVVEDTHSSSCAACTVGQISYSRNQMDEDQVIQAIDQLLEEKKENETTYNGGNGKVVVYYNFESDEKKDSNKIKGKLQKALRDLHLHHQDVLLFAVGLNEELLKKFAKNDKALVAGAGVQEEEVAKKLYDRISFAPGQLKYPDCEQARSESSAIYENFVSPNVLQHWAIPPKYFYKSKDLKVFFESKNGAVKVCHNRATMKPELESKNCNTTNNRVEFRIPNPCMGFTEFTCASFYFAVMGVPPSDDNGNSRPKTYCEDTKGQWCSTLDQIKFTVIHQGMRCSGCIGLRSLPAVILITIFFAYILHRRF